MQDLDLALLPVVLVGYDHSVTLRVFQEGRVGQPFADLGDLLVDHVDPGSALDPSDYEDNTIEELGTLAFGFARRYESLDVADCVAKDRDAGRGRSGGRRCAGRRRRPQTPTPSAPAAQDRRYGRQRRGGRRGSHGGGAGG